MIGSNLLRRSAKAAKFAHRYTRGYFERGRFTPRAVPKLSIETTNICNADCVFCANSKMTRRKEPLSFEAFTKTVDEFAAMGGTQIDFNVTIGDPLLDPKLLERARYVRRYPQFGALGFVTTLQWLHRWNLDEFLASGITWLSISITLSGRETYKAFFGVDLYDRTLNNLVTLIRENEKCGRPLGIHIALKPTDEPIEKVVQHPDLLLLDTMVDQDLVAEARGTNVYVDDWIGAVTLPAYLKKRPLVPRTFRPCRLLYTGLMVYSNGKVGACACRDFDASSDLILGRVQGEPLEQIWRGDVLARLRKQWRTRNAVPQICQSCRHYLY
jgi:radical SAM protein with 4Fe4S-binding SPASM domain